MTTWKTASATSHLPSTLSPPARALSDAPPQAKRMAEQGEGKSDGSTLGEEAVRKELDNLLSALGASVKGVDPEDLK